MKTSVKVDTYCGLDCNNCEWKNQFKCTSCIEMKGCPSWCTDTEKCEIAECVKAKQVAGYGLEFCGECADFPCDLLKKYSNDPEHGDKPAGARIARCSELKKARVDEGRSTLSNVVAPCGLHCDHCFLGQWCGGCRSDYNCCSFATLFADKKCPNLVCSLDKKLDGCYECPELIKCKKGFYNGENGVTAKADALFINKHGIEKYKVTLKKVIDAGFGDLDKDKDGNSRSVEQALELLEKYM